MQKTIINKGVQAHYFMVGFQQAWFFDKPCNVEKFQEVHFDTIEHAEIEYLNDAYEWFKKGFEFHKKEF